MAVKYWVHVESDGDDVRLTSNVPLPAAIALLEVGKFTLLARSVSGIHGSAASMPVSATSVAPLKGRKVDA